MEQAENIWYDVPQDTIQNCYWKAGMVCLWHPYGYVLDVPNSVDEKSADVNVDNEWAFGWWFFSLGYWERLSRTNQSPWRLFTKPTGCLLPSSWIFKANMQTALKPEHLRNFFNQLKNKTVFKIFLNPSILKLNYLFNHYIPTYFIGVMLYWHTCGKKNVIKPGLVDKSFAELCKSSVKHTKRQWHSQV